MNGSEFHRATHYRRALLTDTNAQLAFIENPAGELAKHAGIILTVEETAAVTGYLNASRALRVTFGPGRSPGPYDPTPGGLWPLVGGAQRKAPRWFHTLVDAIWEFFTDDE